VTSKGNTTFKNTTTIERNGTTETNSTTETNITVSANGTTETNTSSETNTSRETNVSADSNVTASTLIQIRIYNESEPAANVSDAPNPAPGRPIAVKGKYYDADGGYWPDPMLLSLAQLSEDPPAAPSGGAKPPHLSSGYYDADGAYTPPEGAGNNTNNEKPDS
jgi:hypothetical protein